MVKAEQIIGQNKWWALGKDFSLSDKQVLDFNSAILKIARSPILLKKDTIYIIYGPRRVGKTTFIKNTISELLVKGAKKDKISYFSCDALVSNSKEELTAALDFLLEKQPNFLFIDEINVVKNWEQIIRFLFDQGKFKECSVVITGSPFGVREMLPGRNVNKYFIKPATFRDFVRNLAEQTANQELQNVLAESGFGRDEIKSIEKLKELLGKQGFEIRQICRNAERVIPFLPVLKKLFAVYLHTGGFPSVINSYLRFVSGRDNRLDEEYAMIVDMLIDTLKKRGKSETIAKQIINAVAEKMTSRYGFREITKATEEKTNQVTVIDYLHHLEDVFFLSIIYSYDFSKKMPRWKGDKKIYFTDPFIFYAIRKNLAGKDGPALTEQLLSEEAPAILEGLAANLLIQTLEEPFVKTSDAFIWFYYTATGKEIDFIYKQEEYWAIEIKSGKPAKMLSIPEVKNYVLLADDFGCENKLARLPPLVFFLLIEKNKRHL